MIRVLFFASNPDNTSPLKLDEEIRSITEKIRASEYRDILELKSLWAVRPDDLLQALNEHKPQIVHFSGHGSVAGEIVLMDDSRQSKPVSATALKMLFTTLKDNIRVVVLNACYSRIQAEAIIEVIDCIVGMNTTIGDRAATIFAASFYRAIGFRRSVQEAFEQGKTALLLEGIPEHDIPELLVKPGVDPASLCLITPLAPSEQWAGKQRKSSVISSSTKLPIPEAIISELLYRNDHTCCICRQPRKAVQIHYINGDLSDNRLSSLAVLCADCHSRVDSDEGWGQEFLPSEVKKYKDEWERRLGRRGDSSIEVSVEAGTVDILKPAYCEGTAKRQYCSSCADLFLYVTKYLYDDQIQSTGAWGKSYAEVYEYITGKKQTLFDVEEGGIVSTYIAVRALLAAESNPPFLETQAAQRVIEYLITRQTQSGSFGRRIASRSGIEIHPSIRHTAYAVLMLVGLDGPPENIVRALYYLSQSEVLDLRDDASPCMAAAAVIAVFDNVIGGDWGRSHLTKDDLSALDIDEWPERRTVLLRFIENESRSVSNPYSPLWVPYGGFEKKLFDTTLFTVDLLTLCSSPLLWSSVLKVLKKMSEVMTTGLPFDPSSSSVPDVGISGYFSTICFRPPVYKVLHKSKDGRRILKIARRCFDFALENFGEEKYTAQTSCDTISNLLLLKGCYWKHLQVS